MARQIRAAQMKAIAAIIILGLSVLAIANVPQFQQASAHECESIAHTVSGYQWLPVDVGNARGMVADQVQRTSDGQGGTVLLGRFAVPGQSKITGRAVPCFYATNETGQANSGTQHEMPQWLLTTELTFCGNHQPNWPRPCVRNGIVVTVAAFILFVVAVVGIIYAFLDALPPDDWDGYGAV